jgi:hypothetical protein
MHASVSGEIQWRIDLYRRIFEFCRQGEFSYARFLALVPDRLRLALGDSVARISIPVAIDPGVVAAWRRAAPPGIEEARRELYDDPGEMRRLIRFCQLDPELDPVVMSAWLAQHAAPMIGGLAGLYRKALREIGSGEGGLETAYLVHTLILDSLKGAMGAEHGTSAATGAVTAAVVDLAVEAAAARDQTLPARLGFQFAATTSPFAIGVDPEALIRRPLNAYRTSPEAVQLARRVIREPVETIDLERVIGTLAERMQLDPKLRPALARDTLLELVRDCLLLLVVQRYGKPNGASVDLGRSLLGSLPALQQHLLNRRRREELDAWARELPREAGKAAVALSDLLGRSEAAAGGDPTVLGAHGRLDERAKVHAAGAVALALDLHTAELRRDVTSLIAAVPPEAAERAYLEGRCYRLSADAHPLYRLSVKPQLGCLHLDLRDFARRTGALPERAAADFVQRWFYRPILEHADRLRGDRPEALRLVRAVGEALAFTGDVVVLLELALGVQELLSKTTAELEQAVPEVLGGSLERQREIEEEVARLQARLETVEGALVRATQDERSIQILRDGRSLIEQELALLSAARERGAARLRGAPIEVGAYLSYGDLGESIEIGDDRSGRFGIWLSKAQQEAAEGAGRSEWVRAELERRLDLARRVPGTADIEPAFRVRVRRRRAELPPELSERVGQALARRSIDHVRTLSADFADWLGIAMADALRQQGPGGEIDNAGVALSAEALEAFRREREGVLRFRPTTLDPSQLPDPLRQRFLIDPDPQQLVACTAGLDGRLVYLFRLAGEVTLRSADPPRSTQVWEVIPASHPLAAALGGGFVETGEAS